LRVGLKGGKSVFPYFRPQDIADILIMTFLVYQLYSWFKNTKALQVVLGLLVLGVIYVVTKSLGLFMTSWILQELGTVLLVLLIVVFQGEIRQALYRLSLLRKLFDRQESPVRIDLLDFSATIFSLAAQRIGALVVFQRDELLDDYILHGVPLDSVVTGELLHSIFIPLSPLHDGAVLIKDGRVAVASCHLPLSVSSEVPQHYGTRHRAGLGLSERSDAAVVIVSEERGEVSLALGGELQRLCSPEQLHETLTPLLLPLNTEAQRPCFTRRLFANFGPKLAVFALVLVSWVLLTFRQGEILTVTAPIKFHNLPDTLSLTRSSPEEVDVQLKAFSNLIPSPKPNDVWVDLDLSRLREGGNSVSIRKDDIKLPPGLMVATIERATVRVTAEKTPQRGAARALRRGTH
jgi:diadenylate cyclase